MIIRTKKPDRFTVISNRVLEDRKIGWGALGLLSYLLSRPDNWQVMPMQLANMRKQGRDAVYSMLRELVEYGYAEHVKSKSATGGIWYIYDKPGKRDLLTNIENPDTEKPELSTGRYGKAGTEADPENPDPENPDPDFPTLLKTERPLSTEKKQSTEVKATPSRKTAGNPSKRKTEAKAKKPAKTADTWTAYALAYFNRYGIDPIRNASVNSQLANFVKRVGTEEAPAIAAYFVTHPDAYYTKRGHTIGIMLADAEKLRTEWATQNQVTGGQAHKQEETTTRQNAFKNVSDELTR